MHLLKFVIILFSILITSNLAFTKPSKIQQQDGLEDGFYPSFLGGPSVGGLYYLSVTFGMK
jgi:hypothetical protein